VVIKGVGVRRRENPGQAGASQGMAHNRRGDQKEQKTNEKSLVVSMRTKKGGQIGDYDGVSGGGPGKAPVPV